MVNKKRRQEITRKIEKGYGCPIEIRERVPEDWDTHCPDIAQYDWSQMRAMMKDEDAKRAAELERLMWPTTAEPTTKNWYYTAKQVPEAEIRKKCIDAMLATGTAERPPGVHQAVHQASAGGTIFCIVLGTR